MAILGIACIVEPLWDVGYPMRGQKGRTLQGGKLTLKWPFRNRADACLYASTNARHPFLKSVSLSTTDVWHSGLGRFEDDEVGVSKGSTAKTARTPSADPRRFAWSARWRSAMAVSTRSAGPAGTDAIGTPPRRTRANGAIRRCVSSRPRHVAQNTTVHRSIASEVWRRGLATHVPG